MSPSALAHARARPTVSLSRPSPASLASRATPIVRAGKFSRLSTSGDDDDDDDDDEDAATPSVSVSVSRPRDDDELPDNLFDAVGKAARATNDAIARGTAGSIVELLIPELWDPISGNVMSESGDQLKVWEISREFAQRLSEGGRRVRAVYPDAERRRCFERDGVTPRRSTWRAWTIEIWWMRISTAWWCSRRRIRYLWRRCSERPVERTSWGVRWCC